MPRPVIGFLNSRTDTTVATTPLAQPSTCTAADMSHFHANESLGGETSDDDMLGLIVNQEMVLLCLAAEEWERAGM